MDPAYCRDVVIECFTLAQQRSRLREMLPIGPDEIRANVIDAVRAVLTSLDEVYDRPTHRGLIRLVARMVPKAHSWGTPQDVIDAQTTRIGQVMDQLAASSSVEQDDDGA
ncbi:MAG: hypothetical protein AB7S36_03135 [Planctomycetota bacterium]